MAAPVPNYVHHATFSQGHDGDSFWLNVDFGKLTSGVKLTLPLYFRLYGIDCWEVSGRPHPRDPGFAKGKLARDFTNATLSRAIEIRVQTIKPTATTVDEEKYGRVLANVWVDDVLLIDLLRANGYEKESS